MEAFDYRDETLYCEEVPLAEVASRVGTPCYVYSKRALLGAFQELDQAFGPVDRLICYSVKSNSNLSILKLLSRAGAGMDIVSGGELYRALQAGAEGGRIVYSGVGKIEREIEYAIRSGILSFNAESEAELEALEHVAARTGARAPVSIRVNPDIDSRAHEYTTTGRKDNKFGIPLDRSLDLYRILAGKKHLRIYGIHAHIGSQITELEPFVKAFSRLAGMYLSLREEGIPLEAINIGGGLGISYGGQKTPSAAEFAGRMLPILEPLGCRVILEPGRYINGNAGVLLTRVIYYKQTGVKNFAIVDAGMNDLIRPSLYNAYHAIVPLLRNASAPVKMDVVGPICESGDWLAKDRELPPPVRGDCLAVMSAGAYGFSMSSNYNSRPRGAEVLVDGGSYRIIRRAETYEDLVRGEEDSGDD